MASMNESVIEFIPQVCFIPGEGWVGMVVTSEDQVFPVYTSKVIPHFTAFHGEHHNQCRECEAHANDMAEQWINNRN